MRIGLRVEMRQPVRFVLILVFNVQDYFEQLTTLSQHGMLWIVPSPTPNLLTTSFRKVAKLTEGENA